MSDVRTALANANTETAFLAAAVRATPEQRLQMVVKGREEWFTAAERVVAWRVVTELTGKSLPLDVALLDVAMQGQVPERPRAALLGQLGQYMPSANAWPMLAEKLDDFYMRRRGYELSQAAAARFQDLQQPAAESLEATESELFALHAKKEGAGMRHVSACLDLAYAGIEEAIANRGFVTGGLPFGFTDFDRSYIKGMRGGQVIMFVAPPGGGKTVAMMKVAWNRAFGTGDYDEYFKALDMAQRGEKHMNYLGCPVGVFTLEMDDVNLTERLIITQSKVEMAKMHRGQMSRAEQMALKDAHQRIVKSQLFFEFVPGISIQELRVKARYAVMRHGLKLICIDYAQLLTSSSKAARGNRTQEMVDVSKGIDLMAQECGVPIIVLAQPKQETWGHRAGLNAMAETAQLAKDADLVVMFGFWNNIKKQLEGLEKATKQAVMGDEADAEEFEDREADDPTCYAYADIVKNRHGPNTTGKPPIKLRWDRDFFDFVSTNTRLFDSTGKEKQEE